ncbi:proteoglycan 4-like [Alosa alosa]|uniref:proteoglycan 4-like n=1 Tax=Alosa alosa TaxID=278164 RepID=UPI00201519B0|nr:proteoglycan 4-like [Alosa alosa]
MGRRAADPTTPVPVLGVPALVGVRGWRTAAAGGERPGPMAQLTWGQCSIGVQTSPAIRLLKSQLESAHPDAHAGQPKSSRAPRLANGSGPHEEMTEEEYKQGVLKTNKGASLKHRGNEAKCRKGVTFEEPLNDSGNNVMARVPHREVQCYATAIRTNPHLPGGTVGVRALGKREQRYTNGSVVDSELIGGICSEGEGDSAPEQPPPRTREPAVVHAGQRRTPPGPPPSRAPPRICRQCGGRQAASPQVNLNPVTSPTLLSPTEREMWSPLAAPSPGISSAPPGQISRELTYPIVHHDPTPTHLPLHPIIKINRDGRPDAQVTRPAVLEQETRVTRVYPIFAPQRDPPPAYAPPACPVRAVSPPSCASPPLKQMMTVTVTQETRASFTPRRSLPLARAPCPARPSTLMLPTLANGHASTSESGGAGGDIALTTSKPQQTIALTDPRASGHASPPRTLQSTAATGSKCTASQQTDAEPVTSKVPPAVCSNTHPKISGKLHTHSDAQTSTLPLAGSSTAHQNSSRPHCTRDKKLPCTPYVKRKVGSISKNSAHCPPSNDTKMKLVPEICPSQDNTGPSVKTHSENEQPSAACKIASRQSIPVKDPLIPRSVDASPAIPLTHPGILSVPVTLNGTNTDFKHSTSTCKYIHAHCKPSPRPETCHKPILKAKGLPRHLSATHRSHHEPATTATGNHRQRLRQRPSHR